MEYYSYLYFLSFFINAFLGLLVLLKNRKSELNKAFFFFTLSIIGWIATLYLFYYWPDHSLVLLLGRLNFAFATLLGFFIFYFAYLFPRRIFDLNKYLTWGLTLETATLFLITLFTPLIDQNEIILGTGRVTVYGVLYPLFIVHFVAYAAACIYFFYLKYRQVSGIEKTQLRYLIWGTLIAVVFGSLTNIFLPLFFGYYELQNVGPLATIILVGFITYAIIRHRLLDIRLAIRAFLVKLIIVSLLAIVFYSIAVIFRSLYEPITETSLALLAIVAAFLLSIFYEPLSSIVKKSTDKIFFQAEYSKANLLKELGLLLSQSLNLEEVKNKITQVLPQMMKSKFVNFEMGKGSETLLSYFKSYPNLLVYDELNREAGEEGNEEDERWRVLEELKKKEASVCVPLISKTGLFGVMFLGEKAGGDAYTSADLDTLETLMYQIATALENASLFTQISEFNQKLKAEVDRATADLAEKNRNLTVLRRLDEIIINTLDLDEICQKIVDTIAWEAGFVGGLISLLNERGDRLLAKSVSATPVLTKMIKLLPLPLTEFSLDLVKSSPANLFVRALKMREPFYSGNFSDFFLPPLDEALCQKMQVTSKIKHLVAYPLSSKGRPLGVITFALHKPYDQLTSAEMATLKAFMDEAGIAIENAKLYQDLKRINDELKLANEKLLELDKMKDELVSIASHELRTPMTAIKSYLWLILNRYRDRLDEKMQLYLDRAYESSDRMINLVNDMLSVSRLDTGRMELNLASTDLNVLIESVIEELSQRAKDLGLKLSFVTTKGQLPKALIDSDKIREVIMNLLGNAFKFTPKGGSVTVGLQKIKEEIVGEMLKVSISDTGRGIAKEDLPRLFQKFGRLASDFVTTAETSGTGLGLYIAKGIVGLHNGKIWAESKIGKGSTFFFTVKAAG